MTFEDEPVGDSARSAALDGWVAAFEREIEQTGDFASSVGAMTAHGCFDVQAVVERWILANPTRTMTFAPVQPAPRETAPLRLVREEELVLEEDPAVEEELVLEEVPALVEKSQRDSSRHWIRSWRRESPGPGRPPTSRISAASCKAESSVRRSTRPSRDSGS